MEKIGLSVNEAIDLLNLCDVALVLYTDKGARQKDRRWSRRSPAIGALCRERPDIRFRRFSVGSTVHHLPRPAVL